MSKCSKLTNKHPHTGQCKPRRHSKTSELVRQWNRILWNPSGLCIPRWNHLWPSSVSLWAQSCSQLCSSLFTVLRGPQNKERLRREAENGNLKHQRHNMRPYDIWWYLPLPIQGMEPNGVRKKELQIAWKGEVPPLISCTCTTASRIFVNFPYSFPVFSPAEICSGFGPVSNGLDGLHGGQQYLFSVLQLLNLPRSSALGPGNGEEGRHFLLQITLVTRVATRPPREPKSKPRMCRTSSLKLGSLRGNATMCYIMR